MKDRKDQETLEQLVSETMDGISEESRHATARGGRDSEAQAKKERQRKMAAVVVIPVFLVLTAVNLGSFGSLFAPNPRAVLPEDVAIRPVMLEILNDAVEELDEYRAENGRYPARPDFLGPADGTEDDAEPFVYVQAGPDAYTLSFELDGDVITYDSSEDADVFFASVRR